MSPSSTIPVSDAQVLFAKVDAMKEVIDERGRLYKERDESRRTAVDAALTAVKEQTKASFEASEKAIVKAEEAQKSYTASHSDLAWKMDEQSKATMPRSETETRFRGLEEKINELRSGEARGIGRSAGSPAMWSAVSLGAALLMTLLSIAALIYAARTP